MLYGRRPFHANVDQETIATSHLLLHPNALSFDAKPVVSQGAKDFIKRLLAYDHQLRPDVHEAASDVYLMSAKDRRRNVPAGMLRPPGMIFVLLSTESIQTANYAWPSIACSTVKLLCSVQNLVLAHILSTTTSKLLPKPRQCQKAILSCLDSVAQMLHIDRAVTDTFSHTGMAIKFIDRAKRKYSVESEQLMNNWGRHCCLDLLECQ